MGQGVVAFSPAHAFSRQAVIFVKRCGHDGLPPPKEMIQNIKCEMNDQLRY
jgi:hypothetical protein